MFTRLWKSFPRLRSPRGALEIWAMHFFTEAPLFSYIQKQVTCPPVDQSLARKDGLCDWIRPAGGVRVWPCRTHGCVFPETWWSWSIRGNEESRPHDLITETRVCVCVCGWHLSHSNVTLTSRLLADAGGGPMLLRKQGQEPALSLPVRTPVPSRYSERPQGNSWSLKEGSLSWSLILGFKQTNKQKRTARSPPFRRGIR